MNALKLRVITESLDNVHLIRILLAHELSPGMKFYASRGGVSPVTVGRNILVHEGGPVLIAVDSHTLDLEHQSEIEATASAAIGGLFHSADNFAMKSLFGVFTFLPSAEVVFFEAPDAMRRVLGKEIDERTIEEGKARPRQTLQTLFGVKEDFWFSTLLLKIDEPAIDLLRQGEQATRLREMALGLLPVAAAT